jgi:hypothetical protein
VTTPVAEASVVISTTKFYVVVFSSRVVEKYQQVECENENRDDSILHILQY